MSKEYNKEMMSSLILLSASAVSAAIGILGTLLANALLVKSDDEEDNTSPSTDDTAFEDN